jgi:uncharacterized protein
VHPAAVLGVYVAVVFAGGAALGPWLWHGVQGLAAEHPALAGLARHPFHRYVDRAILGLAVLGLWPLVRALRLPGFAAAGVTWSAESGRNLRRGLGLGFLSLALVAGVAVGTGARQLDPGPDALRWGRALGNALLSAVAVALLEELVFRAAVFTGLRRRNSFAAAALLSAALYAVVHFLQRSPAPAQVEWHTGFVTLAHKFRGVLDGHQLVPGLFTLGVAGWLLAWARERTGQIWFAVGLHAGWVFWLKAYHFATRPVPGANVWLWGTERLLNGWLGFAVLAVLLPLLPVFCPRPRPPAPAPPPA